MGLRIAAVLYRPDEVTEVALRRGFASSLAGYALESASLATAELPGAPGWHVAFFETGLRGSEADGLDLLDLAVELFEEEVPPGMAIRDLAGGEAVVHALVYSDELLLDDASTFTATGLRRRFVREGDDGPEAGTQDDDAVTLEPLDADDDPALDRAAAPRRGSTFLSEVLGVRLLPALAQALYLADRRLRICLVDPDAATIAATTAALVTTLRRSAGRGSFEAPSIGGVAPPGAYGAFLRGYDFSDPSDPGDLYRGLALGRVEGTLHFHRRADLDAAATDHDWLEGPAKRGLYPIASLRSGALGGAAASPARRVAIAPDGETLCVVDARGRDLQAGPTFGELLLYLSLGFRGRSDAEEELIEATMLRAKVRCS